jgi:hypothetical protein
VQRAVRVDLWVGEVVDAWSRMHCANSNAAACSGLLGGGAVAPAASTVAMAAVATAAIAAHREILIDVPLSTTRINADDGKPIEARGISGTSLDDP